MFLDVIEVCRVLDATSCNLSNIDEIRKLFPRMETKTVSEVIRAVLVDEDNLERNLDDPMEIEQQMVSDEVNLYNYMLYNIVLTTLICKLQCIIRQTKYIIMSFDLSYTLIILMLNDRIGNSVIE